MSRDRSLGDRTILEGDIIVMAVASHYALGRQTAAGPNFTFLGSYDDRVDALNAACRLAGALNRVFLYPKVGTTDYRPIDCDHSE